MLFKGAAMLSARRLANLAASAFVFCALTISLAAPQARAQSGNTLQVSDYQRLRGVGQVEFSPDGKLLAYTIIRYDRPGRPWSQLYVMDLAANKSTRMGAENEASGSPVWSPDGRWLAYMGAAEGKHGLVIAHPDGSGLAFLAEIEGTNAPLPNSSTGVVWSPDSKQIAFVSATPGPETADASGDPVVITRYMYKPDAGEGMTRFNDNRRLHLFVVDVATKQVRQLTSGVKYEHSIDWSPSGDELLFVSDDSATADQFFNYDVFAFKLSDNSVRRLTATETAEYRPRWSPDGKFIAYSATKRGLTDRETTMEDTHVWLMNADGASRHELVTLDDRQGAPTWSPDGRYIYFTGQERGMVRLYRQAINAAKPELLISDRGSVGSFSVARDGSIAYVFDSPHDMPELFLKSASGSAAPKQLTNLNSEILSSKQIADVESFTFVSNDNKFEVEAFLVKPLGITPQESAGNPSPGAFHDAKSAAAASSQKFPMIVNIHGGPHGQNGPAFNFKDQIYAAHGFAVLHVNYRGSTGYGQAFADAVFGDQNGNEAQDVLYGVSAALRRYIWIDRDRLGIEGVSYGGQLTDWLITQTRMFRAAIPIAGISNLISYNYMTYYNQYEQMEFGQLPHQDDLMNILWERSALKHVAAVATPTMFMHGENDNDVPIAEAEQYYIALKDVGVETIFVRYPREGHGIRESAHTVDSINRCLAWYDSHFTPLKIPTPTVP
jgi:dipeptidyl aminopeptidase/acylaminoacyl peptidase